MKKLIAIVVAAAFATPALAQTAKPANPAVSPVAAPVAKPADVTKPQPASSNEAAKPNASKDAKPADVKKDEKKTENKTDNKSATPAAGTQPTGTQKTTEKPVETKKQ